MFPKPIPDLPTSPPPLKDRPANGSAGGSARPGVRLAVVRPPFQHLRAHEGRSPHDGTPQVFGVLHLPVWRIE